MEVTANQNTYRNYVFFWVGQLTSLLGSNIVQFAIIWYVTVATNSAFILGIAAVLGIGTQVFLTPIAGVYVDRWRRKLIIGSTDFAQAAATLVLILVFWLPVDLPLQLITLLFLLTVRGVMQAFHSPAVGAIIPAMVPRDKLARMNSLNYLSNGLVALIGPAIAAVLLAYLPLGGILWIDVLTFLIAIFPLLLIKIPEPEKQPVEKPSFISDFSEGLSFIRTTRGLLPLMLTATALNFFLSPFGVLLPYFVKVTHGGGSDQLAFVMVALNLGTIIASIFMLTRGVKERRFTTMIFFLYLLLTSYVLTALTPTGWFILMAFPLFFAGISSPIINIMVQTIIQIAVPLEKMGRIGSVISSISAGITPLGMFLAGVFGQLIGPALLYVVCGVLAILVATFCIIFTDMRHLLDLGTAPSEAIQDLEVAEIVEELPEDTSPGLPP